jgi:hypothetical protein
MWGPPAEHIIDGLVDQHRGLSRWCSCTVLGWLYSNMNTKKNVEISVG